MVVKQTSQIIMYLLFWEEFMDKTKKLLGGRIKEIRKLKGLSQEELAERVAIDPKHLSRIEVGRGFPSLDTLENLAKCLKVDLKDFFDYSHKDGSMKNLKKIISDMLKEADETKLRLLVRIIRDVVR